MSDGYQLKETWGEENNQPAHQPCPMCGEERDQSAQSSNWQAGQILMRLALINKDTPMVLQVLLRRVLMDTAKVDCTLEAIAGQVVNHYMQAKTTSRQAIMDLCRKASKDYPELSAYLTPKMNKEKEHDR